MSPAELRARAGSIKKTALDPRGRSGNGDAMAMADDEDELLRSRTEGWRGFRQLLGWVITGAVLALALMALFLL